MRRELGPHGLDGVWWPRSHDLREGLPGLLAALDARWPGISRVTVSGPMWRTGPEELRFADRDVHINRSPAAARSNTICLLSYGVGRCDLLVVPPGATADEARVLMDCVVASEDVRAAAPPG
ncbi:DUF5994 family protein [Streptomyces sp. NPDC088354]|uniref:DUF5994 family protein n=1 Tax=unclassified Streptomyces TaxID=2593676 RepID=UPI0029A6678F|nr:DUF5994 family protein [Streptomyces sp. MI02-7b]MDX3072622.1 DUF5994 family protein [Streptomyces sp. MI02-7b]